MMSTNLKSFGYTSKRFFFYIIGVFFSLRIWTCVEKWIKLLIGLKDSNYLYLTKLFVTAFCYFYIIIIYRCFDGSIITVYVIE